MAELISWCRGCDSLCGLLVRTASGRVVQVRGDPGHPLSGGFDCALGRSAAWQASRDDRLTSVLRRGEDGALAPSSWTPALRALGSCLAEGEGRREASFGVLVGATAWRSQRLRRVLSALAGSSAAVRIFTEHARLERPFHHAARHVLGAPCSLRSDLERARHLLLLGGSQLDHGWAPGHAGQTLLRRLAAPGRGPGLTVADPRRSRLAERARVHLPLRPGTELYLLLGMVSAILNNGWGDHRFLTEHCAGLEALEDAVSPWSPGRVAGLCGLRVEDVTAEAMRFSRAATATVVFDHQALGTPWATLTAWASLVLHAITGNLLQPGGLYAHPGALVACPTPATLPDTELPGAIRGGMRGLLCLGADPLESIPSSGQDALGGLELLVCHDRQLHRTARHAHWVLPATHFLEEAELGIGDACDRHWLQWSAGQAVQPGACRAPWELVLELLDGCSGSGSCRRSGVHPERAEREALARLDAEGNSSLPAPLLPAMLRVRTAGEGAGEGAGPVDRARWEVAFGDGRVRLDAEPMLRALRRHHPAPGDASWPLSLLSSARRDAAGRWERSSERAAPGVGLHPDLGFQEGQEVLVRSPHGSVRGRVRLDAGLRPDVVDLPAGWACSPTALLDAAWRDPWSGNLRSDGQPCRVEPVEASASPKPLA
jgi:anaerobic selenocysteine-containing dehydrogenase